MPVSSVTAAQYQQQYNSPNSQTAQEPLPRQTVARRWENAFVPNTSPSWEGKPICVDEFDENPNCCASGYDIEAIVEESYEVGLQEHPGVKVLDKHPRPCVTTAELEILADELAPMAIKSPKRSKIPGIPECLNIKDHPATGTYDYDAKKFCVNLVKDVIKHSYGVLKDIPQKKLLGENYAKVRNYCAEAIEYRFGIVNVIENNLPVGKPRLWETNP